ncbi:hypothetical protein KP509_37G048300 [Ceratopteris richardii]|uniref:Uncharacterized protein n=1 Tax=Ceratopteris richardii TaxID=49495 RepID=A0A8T2Q8N1_CERRI|nr:hypothetical protein KP509_37G048300 [Ceratopteris richardii]
MDIALWQIVRAHILCCYVGASIVVPAAIYFAGFTTAGIAAGSLGATLMSTYGGAVPAGSLCAVLQSIGAAGLAGKTVVLTQTVAAGLGLAGFAIRR